MASGIIYLAIIGMWVAYFLPRWVHNKIEFSGKSVERYKSALRVVASTTQVPKLELVQFTQMLIALDELHSNSCVAELFSLLFRQPSYSRR